MVYKKTTQELVKERPSPLLLRQLARTPVNLVVDNVRSLDNVGLLFRLCELARVNHIYVTGYTGYPKLLHDTRPKALIDRHQRRIAKTAVYALSHQPWDYVEDPVPLVAHLKEQGSMIVALEQTQESVAYHQAEYHLPLTLIIGHERQGIRQELLDLADILVEIPILGLGNSHNVAIATSIVLYHILGQTNQI